MRLSLWKWCGKCRSAYNFSGEAKFRWQNGLKKKQIRWAIYTEEKQETVDNAFSITTKKQPQISGWDYLTIHISYFSLLKLQNFKCNCRDLTHSWILRNNNNVYPNLTEWLTRSGGTKFSKPIEEMSREKLNVCWMWFLSPGQTDSQVLASSGKLNLRRDLRWMAKRTGKFPRKCTKVAKKELFQGYGLSHWTRVDLGWVAKR